jgi:hypothetical protein
VILIEVIVVLVLIYIALKVRRIIKVIKGV